MFLFKDSSENYTVDSLQLLEFPYTIRHKPALYIGSTSQKGVNQLLYECLDNSIDEFIVGYGNIINISVDKNLFVTVEDFGRGIPVGVHPTWKDETGKPLNALTGVLTRLHAGSKLFNTSATSGTYGVGIKATNALSAYFKVIVKRDGKMFSQEFSKGLKQTEVLELGKSSETGTTIVYKPDEEIFKSTIEFNCKDMQNRLLELSYLNKGLTINYNNELTGVQKTFYSETGISEYILKQIKNKKLLFNEPIYFNGKYEENDKKIITEISFIYDDEIENNEYIKTFANNINTYEGGFHLQGFRLELRKQLNQYGINKKIIQDNLEMKYLLDGVHAIVSLKINSPELEGQTKTKLGNIEAQSAVENIIANFFNDNMKNNKFISVIELIINKAKTSKEADEAAKKARINVRKASQVAKIPLPGKLADCEDDDGYSELIMCEGDSASGGIKVARNRKYQAVLPLRGKIKNVEKADFDKALDSEVVRNIIAAAGTGVGKECDINKSRYDKYIICCFTGDTKVKMLDGTSKSFEELVDMEIENPGRDFWVYALDENKNVVPGRGFSPRITRYINKLVYITLDSGDVIKCTPDHKIMLRNGQYMQAGNLLAGDSLMALYTKHEKLSNKTFKGTYDNVYEKFLNPKNSEWEWTHRTILNYFDNKDNNKEYVSHHKDHNRFNNEPNNLEWKKRKDHNSYHITTYNQSDEHKERVKEMHQNGEYEHTYWGNNGYNGSDKQKLDTKSAKKSSAFLAYNQSEEKRKKLSEFSSDPKNVYWSHLTKQARIYAVLKSLGKEFNAKNYKVLSPQGDFNAVSKYPIEDFEKYCEENCLFQQAKNAIDDGVIGFRKITDNKGVNLAKFTKLKNNDSKKLCMEVLNKLRDLDLEFNEENFNTYRKGITFIDWDMFTNKVINNQLGTELEVQAFFKRRNHKVVSVEYIDLEEEIPVYCMTVDKYHNFAIECKADASGVYVCNCDADLDANHIQMLVLTLFYRYMYPLLKNGMIYFALPPLYRVLKGKEIIYLKDDHELKEFKEKNKGKFELQRFKG